MAGLEEKNCKTARGVNYRYYISPSESKDTSKPTILLLHGFPDSALLWKKMLPHLASLPNRLLIPDLLGYGGTDKPTDPKQYVPDSMAQDLIDIMDSENIDKVISTGHDWGSSMAQRFYNFHPDRTVALIMLSIAYIPPNKKQDFEIQAFNSKMTQIFGYPLYEYWNFFTSAEAPQIVDQNLDRFWEAFHGAGPVAMKEMFCVPGAFREYLTNRDIPRRKLRSYAEDDELKQEWMSTMKAGGMAAPFCWYRCKADGLSWESEKKVADENIKVNVPTLFVGCTEDNVGLPVLINQSKDAGLIPDLKVETLESGHHCPYEKPEEVAGMIKAFVEQKGL